MSGYHPLEFLIYLLIFGGILGLVIYGFGRATWEHFRPRPRDPNSVPSRETLGSTVLGLAAGAFLLWLFGSLFFGMLGFDTGFR